MAEFVHVGGIADKGTGDVVRPALYGECQILVIFFRECRKIEAHAGEIDMAA